MYDVIYIDQHGGETRVAHRLVDRGAAADIARREAAHRNAGRMVLPGSAKQANCVYVIPVGPSLREA